VTSGPAPPEVTKISRAAAFPHFVVLLRAMRPAMVTLCVVEQLSATIRPPRVVGVALGECVRGIAVTATIHSPATGSDTQPSATQLIGGVEWIRGAPGGHHRLLPGAILSTVSFNGGPPPTLRPCEFGGSTYTSTDPDLALRPRAFHSRKPKPHACGGPDRSSSRHHEQCLRLTAVAIPTNTGKRRATRRRQRRYPRLRLRHSQSPTHQCLHRIGGPDTLMRVPSVSGT